jgi:hypothetical protein
MNQFELSFQELLTIEFAFNNRLEFLRIQQDSNKFQPQLYEYFLNAESEVKNLAKKLNIKLESL